MKIQNRPNWALLEIDGIVGINQIELIKNEIGLVKIKNGFSKFVGLFGKLMGLLGQLSKFACFRLIKKFGSK